MKHCMLVLAVLSSVVFCGGCWMLQSPASSPVETYDLQQALPGGNPACRFARIRNLSPAGRKMLFRHESNRMTEGSACWIQSPEAMLQRYLECAFPESADAPLIRMTILRFELDRTAKTAVMTLELACRKGTAPESMRRLTITAPLAADTGSAAAEAMSLCAEKLIKSIITTIQEN